MRRGSGYRWLRRGIALSYLMLLLLLPLATIVRRAFAHGASAFWAALTTPEALHALKLTLIICAIAVPANTIFGVVGALMLARRTGPGAAAVGALIDLPLALSPVVVGLSLVLAWGLTGWFGPWLTEHDMRVVFALPGMVLATMLVSLPFVMREVLPVLREIGTDQQETAATLGASPLQVFRRITLPMIRPALIYGVVLTSARALGEYGAVAVVSGRIVNRTETLTLRVKGQFDAFDVTGAYAIAVLLAALAVLTLVLLTVFSPGRSGLRDRAEDGA
jgi:sulfate transport system permease protein